MFRPFRARVSVWVLLTQAFSLGFVISPLWGSRAHTLSPAERENRLRAQARRNCVFLLPKVDRDWRSHQSVRRRSRMRGHFPSGLATNKQYSFILFHTSADKRSGGVSGALRGGQGRETGHGARAIDSSLPTRHLSVPSSCPAAGSRERAGMNRTGMDRPGPSAPPAPKGYLTPFPPGPSSLKKKGS